MNIVYLNSSHYDFLTATLIEGLDALGHRVFLSHEAGCGTVLSDEEIQKQSESADLIVVGSNRGVRSHLLQGIENPRKVFVDGSDYQEFAVVDNIRHKLVFKRELSPRYPDAEGQFIFPMPFAAEKRYFTSEATRRDIAVSFVANMRTNPLRGSVHQRLKNFNHPAIVSGTTNERSYSVARPRSTAYETPRYRQLLRRSMISVSVAGAGYDTARFWEILAAGAMLLTQDLDLVIPHGFTDGVDCVTFRTLEEFDEKLLFYLNRPDQVKAIAARGHSRLMAHHTTAARAGQFLEIVARHIDREGYCQRFLHPEIRALEELCIGRGLDVGCGTTKTTPNCIGVDVVPASAETVVAGETDRMSVADVAASGDDLPMFADGSMDFVVARHDLGRYRDPGKTLQEWKRILRPGGRIGVVVVDQKKVSADELNPTHQHHFTQASLTQLVSEVDGLRLCRLEPCLPNWSLLGIFEKTD